MTAPLKGPARARPGWTITEHAVDRYLERVRPGASRGHARHELEQHCAVAHYVKTLPSGIEYWRGPKPRRIRLRVERDGDTLRLVSVLEAFDGLRRC